MNNLLYILNGESTEQVVYRASQVIMSDDFNAQNKEKKDKKI